MTRYLAMNEWSHSFTLGPVSAYDNSTNESSKGSFREDNRQTYEHSSSVDTDNLSTDLHSVTNQSSLSTARPKMKRKQRTTFSPLEVWELERVFAQRPYLMPEDEDELVQKLGLTVRNVRVRFVYLSLWILCKRLLLYAVESLCTKKIRNIYLHTYTAVSKKVFRGKKGQKYKQKFREAFRVVFRSRLLELRVSGNIRKPQCEDKDLPVWWV